MIVLFIRTNNVQIKQLWQNMDQTTKKAMNMFIHEQFVDFSFVIT